MATILDELQLEFNYACGEFEELLRALRADAQAGKRLDEVERDLMSLLRKVGKAALQDYVTAAGDGDAGPTLEKDGVLLKRTEASHSRTYRSIFGSIMIRRYVYSKGKKQKHAAAPLDERLGLPAAETSYLLEQWMGSLAIHVPYDVAANWLQDTFGIGGNSTTIENRIRKLGQYTETFGEEVEDKVTDEQEVIVVHADAKGVPIRTPWEEVLHRELGRKPHLRHRKNNYERTDRRWLRGDQAKTQQATVGACYSIGRNIRSTEEALDRRQRNAKEIPNPCNKRLWGELSCVREGNESRGAERVFQQLAAHVTSRDPSGLRELVCIMDGASSLWKLQQEYLPQAIPIIDIFHVTEKLWAVAHCLERDGSKAAENRVTHYLRMLLDGKVDSVRGLFQRMLNQQEWTRVAREKIQHAIDYFRNNRDAMQYHEYLAKGYPIGSGVIEGACKHVIGDRFCRSGMRWEIDGAQPVLHLRTIHLSGRWEAFTHHRIQKEQTALYGQIRNAA